MQDLYLEMCSKAQQQIKSLFFSFSSDIYKPSLEECINKSYEGRSVNSYFALYEMKHMLDFVYIPSRPFEGMQETFLAFLLWSRFDLKWNDNNWIKNDTKHKFN